MNFKEAIKAMLEGNKVRATEWFSHFYMTLSDSGFINQCGNIEEISEYAMPKEWEIYKEHEKLYTFNEAYKLLKQGYKMTRKEITNKPFYYYLTQGASHPQLYNSYFESSGFSDKDIDATDWVIWKDPENI